MTTTIEKELAISSAGSWFERDGDKVDLSNRPSLKRILARLVQIHHEEAGRSVSVHELMESGWPGEVMVRESGNERVYTAIRTLRKLGLQGVLLTKNGGYMLDPGHRIHAA